MKGSWRTRIHESERESQKGMRKRVAREEAKGKYKVKNKIGGNNRKIDEKV